MTPAEKEAWRLGFCSAMEKEAQISANYSLSQYRDQNGRLIPPPDWEYDPSVLRPENWYTLSLAQQVIIRKSLFDCLRRHAVSNNISFMRNKYSPSLEPYYSRNAAGSDELGAVSLLDADMAEMEQKKFSDRQRRARYGRNFYNRNIKPEAAMDQYKPSAFRNSLAYTWYKMYPHGDQEIAAYDTRAREQAADAYKRDAEYADELNKQMNESYTEASNRGFNGTFDDFMGESMGKFDRGKPGTKMSRMWSNIMDWGKHGNPTKDRTRHEAYAAAAARNAKSYLDNSISQDRISGALREADNLSHSTPLGRKQTMRVVTKNPADANKQGKAVNGIPPVYNIAK